MKTGYQPTWVHLRGGIEMSRLMFAGFPSFSESVEEPPVIDAGTQSLHSMRAVCVVFANEDIRQPCGTAQ